MIDPTFAGLLDRAAEASERPLLWEDASGAWLSEARVVAHALALAGALKGREKRLAFLFASNTAATLVAFLALTAAGHAIALIDPTLPDDKVAPLMAAYQPELLIGGAGVSRLAEAEAGEWTCAPVATEDAALDGLCLARRTTLTGQPAPHPDLGLLLLTSGTTGSAKFVRLSHRAVVANARQIAQSLALTPQSVAIAHLPFHYSYGLSVVTSHLVSGGRIALLSDAITAESFWAKVKASGGTHFPGVPFHYAVLSRLGLDVVPPAVDTFTQAGGHLDARLQAVMLDKTSARNARFFVMYGQTEAAPRMACLPAERLGQKIGAVGLAMPGARFTIIGPDGTALPTGGAGLVVYEGPNVMLGYAETRADLTLSDTMAGRLETGDLGHLDAEGFLSLSGRAARFAKIAGLRLSLDDIERQLARLGPVACVDLGERIAAVFEGAIPPEAKAQAKALALASKIPPTSFVLRALPELPRKSSGKLDYAGVKGAMDV